MGVSMIQTPGGEVRVETGVGTVMKVEDKGERNVQVSIRADHLDKPVTGWADSHAGQLPAEGDRVAYRVDVHRKRKIDPTRPFDTLESHEKVRDLVALRAPEDIKELELALRPPGSAPVATPPAPNGTSAPTTPPPAPAAPVANPGASPAQPAAAPAPPAQVGGPVCQHCGLPLAGAPVIRAGAGYVHKGECPADPGRPFVGDEENPAPAPAPAPGPAPAGNVPPRRPRVAEGKPWELYNSDGSINMGSYAMTAAVGFVELAHRLAAEQAARWTAEGADEHVSMGQVEDLAATLLEVADRVQAANREDGHTDRLDNSHTRARGAVREALWVYPVRWGAAGADRQEWVEELVEHASTLVAMAVVLHRRHLEGGR